ncbi:hypothetical protein Mgra_00002585 [Meloidogyne graminicola]|uniref:Uncharacterized protein n=1 Tax=Meloidogyne graminicola TaxID=189291 RepID=A0A8S9ZW44_9BILA|nr:hypothetical protein Mgra_00002585 [Meloidogyne graminicola]
MCLLLYLSYFVIRVIRAFQSGMDRREQSLSGPSAARLREISRQLKLQVEREAVRSRSSSKASHSAEAHLRGHKNSKTPEGHNEAVICIISREY